MAETRLDRPIWGSSWRRVSYQRQTRPSLPRSSPCQSSVLSAVSGAGPGAGQASCNSPSPPSSRPCTEARPGKLPRSGDVCSPGCGFSPILGLGSASLTLLLTATTTTPTQPPRLFVPPRLLNQTFVLLTVLRLIASLVHQARSLAPRRLPDPSPPWPRTPNPSRPRPCPSC